MAVIVQSVEITLIYKTCLMIIPIKLLIICQFSLGVSAIIKKLHMIIRFFHRCMVYSNKKFGKVYFVYNLAKLFVNLSTSLAEYCFLIIFLVVMSSLLTAWKSGVYFFILKFISSEYEMDINKPLKYIIFILLYSKII